MGTILAISISLGFFLILSLGGCICWKIRNNAHKRYERTDKQKLPLIESLLLDLSTIRKITNNFSESNKLGEGGFGGVYKGELADGQEVAVKRLSRGSSQGINELKNEVVLLAKLQHRNLVRLLGVCLEEQERILLYEYAENKSLDKVLFDPNRKGQLNWERRFKIIGGIARGLLYLHEESQVKIIHRDLKASNILLDSDMNPKISDFGLARFFGGDQTQANTSRVAGTVGYMPPEYAMGGNYSSKSDVYGFGVLVLEIVTGRKNSDCFTSEDSIGLLSYVWDNWSMRRAQHIIDASFGRNYSASEALRCIQIGLLCVQKYPADRPTMSTVVLMLRSKSVTIGAPTRPAFLAYSSIISFDLGNNTNSSEQRQSTARSVHSQNELSITELDPR